MGTSFDMRVSSTDTIREIKQRIQRVEGIPIHQQNLIFKSKELKDSRRLCDAGIKNGSIIKLVIAMKGGPISTRRLSVSCEHHMMLKELKELLENTRDEIGDKLAPGSKVSVLVFKEGDILNLLRVIENEDGSYSPYSEKPISPPSRPNRRESQMAMFEKLVEDTELMTKISNLRKRMEDINLKRQLRNTKRTDKTNLSYKLLTECTNDLLDNVDLKIFEKNLEEESQSETEEIALKDKHRIRANRKPALNKSLYSETKGAYSHTKQKTGGEGTSKDSDLCLPLAVPKGNTVHLTRLVLSEGVERPKSTPDSIELEENAQDLWEIHEPASERLKHSATCKFGLLKRRQSLDYGYDGIENPPKQEIGEYNYGEVCSGNFFHVPQFVASPSAIPPQYAPKDQDDLCDYYFRNNSRSPLYGRKSKNETTECSRIQRLKNDCGDSKSLSESILSGHDESIDELYGYYNLGCATELLGESKVSKKKDIELPPVIKKKSRCSECNKRLNITNIYNCRCGKIFCSQHRYSEVHHCNYDYKTEGRRILEHQNPLVTADKINRI
ncbi:ubiquitin, zf-AN1, Rad60-SLD and/or YukD domain containing protein [Asbolus verrucosus]|uniref:Ubiquitin, zf-AN1, Rad60-SLD and/or YukD domain containing protein n=1 Tax=Asbolus verrucosus TaxID=1661398 RepID=A0A482VHF2_ASBVE|nr:ubiquitin, zf-AN1, Rad60-SLD and/or YukD domain containing protein [Asbolus verrucosus]